MFLLFAGERFYAEGGWNDYQGTFASLQGAHDALVAIEKAGQRLDDGRHCEWWHIIDMTVDPPVIAGASKVQAYAG